MGSIRAWIEAIDKNKADCHACQAKKDLYLASVFPRLRLSWTQMATL